ncbi:hypothetical protein CC78DRAFT_354104 [Lojkania enalia]|uniref:Uncharacterized protein n=1 Tax=Lojkania enalia TaxID=147567 RepID=A0A9P4KJT0_9PLEO|nr:hypothetical protein CC78DRAFT_354104 [Didymosphaeria enalia]
MRAFLLLGGRRSRHQAVHTTAAGRSLSSLSSDAQATHCAAPKTLPSLRIRLSPGPSSFRATQASQTQDRPSYRLPTRARYPHPPLRCSFLLRPVRACYHSLTATTTSPSLLPQQSHHHPTRPVFLLLPSPPSLRTPAHSDVNCSYTPRDRLRALHSEPPPLILLPSPVPSVPTPLVFPPPHLAAAELGLVCLATYLPT